MNLRRTGIAVIAAIAATGVAFGRAPAKPDAEGWVTLHASKIRLVAAGPVAPGGPLFAGLEIALDPDWKTYWRMPGDSGVPPSFDWTGSTNLTGVKVLYPAPTRLPEAGGEAIGYKTSVVFPLEVAAKEAGKPVTLKLAIEFGVCREICISATANLELAITPGKSGASLREVAAAVERVPRPQASRRKSDPELSRITLNDGPTPKLNIEARFGAAQGGDVFIEAPEGLYVPLPKKVSAAPDGSVRFESELSRDLVGDLKGKTLTLTLVSEAGATETTWAFP